MKNYNLHEVAEYLGIPDVGKTKLYMILRILGIVESNNSPAQKYIDMQYLAVATPNIPWAKKRNVTLVVGQSGLIFIKKVVSEYLKENPIPKVQKKPRRFYGTNI